MWTVSKRETRNMSDGMQMGRSDAERNGDT